MPTKCYRFVTVLYFFCYFYDFLFPAAPLSTRKAAQKDQLTVLRQDSYLCANNNLSPAKIKRRTKVEYFFYVFLRCAKPPVSPPNLMQAAFI